MGAVAFQFGAGATPLLHHRIKTKVVHAVCATTGGDHPASVHVNPFDVDPSFCKVTVGFRLNGFSGHDERHYFRMICVVVFTLTDTGTNERDGTAT